MTRVKWRIGVPQRPRAGLKPTARSYGAWMLGFEVVVAFGVERARAREWAGNWSAARASLKALPLHWVLSSSSDVCVIALLGCAR